MNFFFQHLENPDKQKSFDTYWSDNSVQDLKGAFAESILFGEKVTIKLTYGAVSKLIDWLGIDLLKIMIEENMVQFCALKPIGTTYLTKKMIEKRGSDVSPGLSFIFGTEARDTTIYSRVYSDLKENTNLSKKERHQLTKLVKTVCNIVENDVIHRASDAARNDITSNIGKELGFPINQNPDSGNLRRVEIRNYIRVTSANINIQLAAQHDCDNLIANRITSRVLENRITSALNSMNLSVADYRILLQLEKVPDFGKLIREDKITFEDLFKLRSTADAIAFRVWLNSVNPNDKLDFARKYQLDLLKRYVDSSLIKTIKVIGYTGLGVATSIVDPSGISSGMIINTFDTFILDALKRKWQPKVFLDQLKENYA